MGGGSYPSAEKQSVYSTAPADRAICEGILSKIYPPFFVYFDGRVRGLISKNFNAEYSFVFSDSKGRLCVLDITIKDKTFCFIGIYGPNATSELPDIFWRIEPFAMKSRRIIFAGDLNAVHDPNVDRVVVVGG